MSSTQPVNYVFLTDAQYITAFTFGLISCSLSLFGSTSIIYLVVKRHNVWNDAEQVHHRIVLGLSVMDVITSSIIFVAPYINREDTGLLFARGNVASCDFGGFFFQFFIGSTFYNCLLSIYFVRTIRYNKSASAALFHHERLFHVIAFLVPIAFGIAGVVTKVFNPSLFLGFCDIEVYPWNCLQNDSNNVQECERGGGAVDILNWPHSVLFMLLNFIGIVATWLVYWTIRQHARKINRRWNPTSSPLDEVQRKRIRAVGIQAICYTAVFFVAFASTLFLTVVRELYEPETTDASDLSGEPVVYASILLIYILFPVQGFLNWLIYIRPRLIRWKDANAEKSWLWAYRQVLKGVPAPITERTSHLSTTECQDLTTSNTTRTTNNINSTSHPEVPSSLSTPSLPPVSEELDDQGRTATLSLSQQLFSNTNSRNSPPEASRAFRPAAERRFSGYCIQLPPNLAQNDE